MSSTSKSDVVFAPKVWSDHISAYVDRKMGLGQLGMINNTLTAKTGETVSFPFWKSIGDAQEPAENEALAVAPLADDSYNVTVKEVGKAVGWKDAAVRKSSASRAEQETEAQKQIAQKLAEKVDKDIITTINTNGAYFQGFTAAAAADTLNVRSLLTAKILGFGDKHEEAVAVAMHSYNFLDMMTDATAGFLKADATDPLFRTPGFQGRLLGMAVFTFDSLPQATDIGGKKVFNVFMMKQNSFGIYKGSEMNVEKDRDILTRETIIAATMWYGVLSLHGKSDTTDRRIVRATFATSVSA